MRLLIIILSVLALGLGFWLNHSFSKPSAPPTADIEGLLWPQNRPLPPFQLTDHQQHPFTLAELKGHWSLIFFGYTHCPDVCPMTLGVLRNVKQQLAAQGQFADDTRYIFVSVDGERDTPAVLNRYLHYFDPAFIGLTGSDAALQTLTQALGIVYVKTPTDKPQHYLVDHTASILLVDPEGRMIGLFSSPHAPDDIRRRYTAMRQFLAEYAG
jgi:protein SCO1/2